MIDFIANSANFPFTLAIAVMIVLFVVELLGMVIGASLSHFIDQTFPDWDLHHDISHDLSEGPVSHVLSWLRIREVPLLVVMIIFLTAFGLIGLLLQGLTFSLLSHFLPGVVSVPVVFLISLPFVRTFVGGIRKILPKDETEVVSEESFIGLVATITLGSASQNSPAQAKIKDHRGKTHYIMLEPEDEKIYQAGDRLLVVRKKNSHFYGTSQFPDSLIKE